MICFSIGYIRPLERIWKKWWEIVSKKTTSTENDDGDLIHSDNDQDTNNEESKEKYQRKERPKYNLELDHSEENERDELENEELFLSRETQK